MSTDNTGEAIMQFGIFSHIPWPEGSDPKTLIDQMIAQSIYGEELGYDSVWLAEHHFSRYGLSSSSLIIAGSIAARTENIRIGTAVIVPTLHNPIRLAEDTATLDVISGGRLDIGYGRGAASYEYSGYTVDQSTSQQRFQEAIKMVEGIWTTSEYTYSGDFYSAYKTNLVPKPLQNPHPPVYIGASRTLETLQFVASTGHCLCVGVVLDTPDAVDLVHRFDALSKKSGYSVPTQNIPFFRYCYVAETEKQAIEDTEHALNWTLDVGQWRASFKESSEVNHDLKDWLKNRRENPPSYDYLLHNRAVIGTPEQCINQIKALEQQGIGYFGCNFFFGDMEHSKVMNSMKLFAEEVIPAFN